MSLDWTFYNVEASGATTLHWKDYCLALVIHKEIHARVPSANVYRSSNGEHELLGLVPRAACLAGLDVALVDFVDVYGCMLLDYA